MILTYNVQLKFQTNECVEFWKSLLANQLSAYNRCVKMVLESKIPLGIKTVHNLCYDVLRAEFPMLSSQVIVKTQQEVAANLKSIRSNKHFADTVIKENKALRLDKRLYSNLTPTSISLPCKKSYRETVSFVLYDEFNKFASQYPMHDPLIFERNGRLFLSVSFEVQEKPCLGETCLGVDLGIRRFVTLSDGRAIVNKEYLARKRKIRYIKRVYKEKKSFRRLVATRRKEKNMSKQQVYDVANEILKTDASIIVMEDLSKIKQNTSKHENGYKRTSHNNRIGQIPFYKLKEVLTYKAQLIGKRVETVSPRFTSQKDCRTDKKDGTRVGCRYYCKDGIVLDADWNAAVNIAKKSKHPISFELPIDSCLNFIGRAKSTAQSQNR